MVTEPNVTAAPAETDLIIADTEAPAAAPAGGASAWAVVRMLLILALAAAAIYGLVFFLKKAARTQPEEDPNLKLVSSVGLGSGRAVHIVMSGTRAWVLGASDGGVSLIAEIEDQEALGNLLAAPPKTAAAPGRNGFNFKAILERLGSGAASGGLSKFRMPGPQDIRRRRDNLRGIQ